MLRRYGLVVIFACLIASCSSKEESSTAPAGKSQTSARKASGETLTDFERSLLSPLLEDIRLGVRPFNDQGIGICEGAGKNCDKYLGTDVGELPPGKYMIRAELRAPDIGPKGTWKITFETQCKTTSKSGNSESTSTKNYSKDYTVSYVGNERGFRLSPLRVIESPMAGGSSTCTYKITAPHPDGDRTYTGSWSVPAKKK